MPNGGERLHDVGGIRLIRFNYLKMSTIVDMLGTHCNDFTLSKKCLLMPSPDDSTKTGKNLQTLECITNRKMQTKRQSKMFRLNARFHTGEGQGEENNRQFLQLTSRADESPVQTESGSGMGSLQRSAVGAHPGY